MNAIVSFVVICIILAGVGYASFLFITYVLDISWVRRVMWRLCGGKGDPPEDL